MPDFIFSDDRQVIVFPVVGAFVIEGDATVFVEPAASASVDFLAVPLLGPVLAVLLHLRGLFILHGSAIIHEGKAYGFVGDKGAGKSTLAAMSLKNRDVEFLTDDLLVVSNEQQALLGYPQMKLSDEALYHSDQSLGRVRPPPINEFPKNQFLLDTQLALDSVPVGGIYELHRASHMQVEQNSLQDSIRILLRYSYIARFADREMSRKERRNLFNTTTALAASGKVKRLYVPDRISELDQVIKIL
ncbi:MAG: hypothetical protein AAGK80_00780 [Pseudomonadota bacterium]